MAILWFVLAFGVDGAIVGSKRRLRTGVVIPIYLFGAWVFGVFSFAILTNAWAPDSFVLLAGVIALLVAPVAYFALPPRPSWQVSIERFYRFALCAFALTALIDAYQTPAGMQPVLLGHEKAYLAVIVLAAPKFRGSQLVKFVVVVALGVAFIKYPSATVGFVAIVSLVCVWLLVARNRTSQNLRAAGLIVSFGLISYNASDWVAQFYAATGRVDNTNTRLGLWDQALSTITTNPLTGSTASESITGLANIRGIIQPVPFHNSFLTLAFCCGVVAVILFGLVLLAIVTSCLSSSLDNRKAAILWLPALLAGVVTMSVNPVLEKLGTALPLYALILCAVPLLISNSAVIDLVEDATDD